MSLEDPERKAAFEQLGVLMARRMQEHKERGRFEREMGLRPVEQLPRKDGS